MAVADSDIQITTRFMITDMKITTDMIPIMEIIITGVIIHTIITTGTHL